MESQLLRSVVFETFIAGDSPTFSLTLWDTHQTDHYGKKLLKYRLTMQRPISISSEVLRRPENEIIFEGDDYHCSSLHASDSDQAIEGIMSFLCLRHGDTDEEYFDQYTEKQLFFRDTYAESLWLEVIYRFDREM